VRSCLRLLTVTWVALVCGCPRSAPQPGSATQSPSVAEAPAPDSPATPEAVTPEAVTTEAVTPEAVTPEAVTPEAATTPESVTPELKPDVDCTHPVLRHSSPPRPTVTAGRGELVVVWNEAQNRYVDVEYRIERQKVGEEHWVALERAFLGGGTDPLQLTDRTLGEGIAYVYRVVSYGEAAESPFPEPGPTLREAERKTVSLPSEPAQAKRTALFVPVTVEPGASAYVKVYRWEPKSRTFVSKGFNVNIGQTLGKRGRGPVDFATGAVLVSAERRTRKHPKLGHAQPVQVISVRYSDGEQVDFDDRDLPAELNR
jgi:hypothetical protein